MRISETLRNIELDEKAQEALGEFLEDYKSEISSIYEEKIDSLQRDLEEKMENDNVTGYTEEQIEEANRLMQEDFQKEKSKIREEFEFKLANAINETYEEIEEKVKEAFIESNEYKSFKKAVDAIAPIIEGSDETLREQVLSLQEELESMKSENNDLNKRQIIETLVSDIPEKFKDTVTAALESHDTEERIYDEFERYLSIIEAASLDNIDEDEIEEEISEMNYRSNSKKTNKKKKSKDKDYNDEDEDDDEEEEENYEEEVIDSEDDEEENLFDEEDKSGLLEFQKEFLEDEVAESINNRLNPNDVMSLIGIK